MEEAVCAHLFIRMTKRKSNVQLEMNGRYEEIAIGGELKYYYYNLQEFSEMRGIRVINAKI